MSDTWTTTSGWTVEVDQPTLYQGRLMQPVLTVRDSTGALVNLASNYARILLYYEPEGSSTRLKIFDGTDTHVTILTGLVTYKDAGNADAPWPGVAVHINIDGDGQPDATTDASGIYTVISPLPGAVVVSVSATAPARGAQSGSNTGTTVLYTTTTINVVCRPAI